MEENAKWLDSIEGKTYQFTNALETMWSNMISSDMVKGFVDFGTGMVQFLDTLPGKITAVLAALAGFAKFKGFSVLGLGQEAIQNIGNIQQALGTIKDLKVQFPTTNLDIGGINAYAAAVSNLTAVQQANVLASSGLSKTQIQLAMQYNNISDDIIREATAHIFSATATKQEAAAQAALFTAKAQSEAASLRVVAANASESVSKQLNAAASILESGASKEVIAAKLAEAAASGAISPAIAAEISAKLGLVAVNKTLGASIKALFLSNPLGWILTIASVAIPLLVKGFDMVHVSAAELKEDVNELKKTSETTQKELESNIKALTTSSDPKQFATLQDEFNMLAQGVDRYGNNISLTTEQYERYKQICDQIVGINPSIAAGYDSATKAIGNNANVLSDLIKLQKIQAKQNIEERISDENFGKFAEDAVNDYENAKIEFGKLKSESKNKINSILNKSFREATKDELIKTGGSYDFDSDGFENDDYIEYVLEQLGETDIASKVQSYWNQALGDYDTYSFMSDYQDKIKANAAKFGVEYSDDLNDAFGDIAKTIRSGGDDIKKANDALIDDFLVVPQGEDAGDSYSKLNDASKNFITDWIKNSSQFKVDANTTNELALENRDKIIDLVKTMASDDFKAELDGKQITGQDLLDQIYNFDTSSVNWQQYKEKASDFVGAMWDAIGGEENAFGISQNDLSVAFGFDFDIQEQNLPKIKEQIIEHTDITTEEIQQMLNEELNAKQVEAFLAIDWNLVDFNEIETIQDIIDKVNDKVAAMSGVAHVQTYSALSSSVDELNSVQDQTTEILHNGIKVTQEYKDALEELGISEERIKECFDETNPLIVKSAAGLRNLVKEAEANTKQNIKLAKSQARLRYHNLVKELNNVVGSSKNATGESSNVAKSILEQIDSVETAIYKYTLLEDSLLGAANAFTKFNDAKEIDAMNTYGDSYVEMVQTIYDAYTKTGEVGSEAVDAAVEALIDPKKLDGLEKGSNEYNKKINEILHNELVQTLTLDDGSLSLDSAAIEKFVKGNLGTLFDGESIADFDLVKDMNLEKAAELTGKTETQLYALFAGLKQYTGKDWLSMLDDSTEGQIANTIADLEELNRKKLALLEDGGYDENKDEIDAIDEKIKACTDSLETFKEKSYNDLTQYEERAGILDQLLAIENQTNNAAEGLDTIREQIENSFTDEEITIDLDTANAQEMINWLMGKMLELEEPTVMTVQYAIEYNERKIKKLKQGLKDLQDSGTQTVVIDGVEMNEEEINAQIAELLGQNEAWKIKFNLQDAETVQEELNAIEEITIGDKTFSVTANGAQEVIAQLTKILSLANTISGMTASLAIGTVGSGGNSKKPGGDNKTNTKVDGTAHAQGTAFKTGNWGAPKTETALVGELGPELLVRGSHWKTIGNNGAEFTQIKKGDIIFNHKQTEDLLSKGYITGRGKAYASGTAYASLWKPTEHKNQGSESVGSKSNKIGPNGEEIEDNFEETMDWFEILLEEINEQLDLMNAKLENAVGISAKNSLIDQLLNTNKYKITELLEGLELYEDYTEKLLKEIPEEYREMAQNGAVKITDFIGEGQEDTVDAIEKYREWAEKVADLNQQLEETKTEISDLAKQAIDNIAEEYENQVGLVESKIDQLDAYNALIETTIGTESASVYEAIIKENNVNIQKLQEQRNKMQAELNKQVAAGNIEKYSQNWYEAIQDISDLDAEIIDLTVDTKDYQDTINDLHWDHFDNLLARLEAISNETENLIDVLSGKDLVDKEGNWTEEGIASIGLYAQKLEMAEVQAKKYEEEIEYLNKNWKVLGYTEQEYIEKLDDLKDGQYDAIKLYNDTKDAIVDLHSERIEAIQEGIEKEIEAYEELIEKEKEALDAEKDLYDFQKNINEQEANISKIRRQLAALSADDPTSRARRAKLEAELAEAQAKLEEAYYERSIEDQQNALDKELENFQNTKDEEIEKLDEYLENTELVVSDSLALIQANTDTVYQTLTEMGKEYGLSIAEAITSPWADGIAAVQNYSEQFGISMSSTVEELQKVAEQYKKTIAEIENAGKESVEQVNANSKTYTDNTEVSTNNEVPKQTPKTVQVGSTINASGAKIYAASDGSGAGKQYYSSDPVYVVIGENNGYWKVRHRSLYNGVTGWFKKSDVKAYAKGTTGVDEDQLALLHELGDELTMHAGPNGKLSFLTKGSAVIPHDISENLMQLGQLDPQDVLERNRPIIGAPHVTNNNIELKLEVGEVVHIDTVTNETVPNLAKTIEKQMDKYVQKMNAEIRKYTR